MPYLLLSSTEIAKAESSGRARESEYCSLDFALVTENFFEDFIQIYPNRNDPDEIDFVFWSYRDFLDTISFRIVVTAYGDGEVTSADPFQFYSEQITVEIYCG